MKKLAILSVSDKTGIVKFADALMQRGFQVVSTGGTLKTLLKGGVKAISIEKITHFPEMLDGRVKTLNPRVHGGILAKRDDPSHMKQLADHHIQPIDLVCVNLYPFKQTISKPDVKDADAIENIDIGGPSMLRAAAKNYHDVIVISDVHDYADFIKRFDAKKIDQTYRRHLAAKVFRHTAAYDALIANYMTKEEYPDQLTMTYEKVKAMRYGENAQQSAVLYRRPLPEKYSVANTKVLHGKAMSYNNTCDLDAGLRMVADYDCPAVVALKHGSPCGIGLGKDIDQAYDRAYEADPVSIFGGIVVLNRQVDLATAKKLHSIFLDLVIAPGFDKDAYDVLAKKKNIRLIKAPFIGKYAYDKNGHDETNILGGMLLQSRDKSVDVPKNFKVVSKVKPTDAQLKAMAFGQTAIKYVESNAVIVNTANQTLGIGGGQPNRIDSAKIAVKQAANKKHFADGVMSSDAYFPMPDCVTYAAKHGIKAIVEPGGSIRDKDSIAAADKYGVALVFTGIRHFKN